MEYRNSENKAQRESYFLQIALKASEECVKEYDTKDLSDEDKDCLKKTSLRLHNELNNSVLQRWAIQPEKRPMEEYYWINPKKY
jgi:hypothetical protein